MRGEHTTDASVRVDVVIDDAWFLRVPTELAAESEQAQLAWAGGVVDERLLSAADGQPLQSAARELVAAALADSFSLVSDGALTTLRLVRGGLPGSVLVQVFAEFVDLDSLDDLVDGAPAALPRQQLPLEVDGAKDARIISTVRQSPEHGAVGFLQFQVLRDGLLIEAVAVSKVLEDLGAGMDAIEELVRHVEVTPLVDAED